MITLDVMMPRLDGWVTAMELRKNPQTSHVKVVLITARAQEADRGLGQQIGVDAYLTKPFDPGEMIRIVRELASAPPTTVGRPHAQAADRRLGPDVNGHPPSIKKTPSSAPGLHSAAPRVACTA